MYKVINGYEVNIFRELGQIVISINGISGKSINIKDKNFSFKITSKKKNIPQNITIRQSIKKSERIKTNIENVLPMEFNYTGKGFKAEVFVQPKLFLMKRLHKRIVLEILITWTERIKEKSLSK